MLSDAIVEFVDNIRDESNPKHLQVVLAPEDSFAFLSFVSSFWRWSSPALRVLN